MTFADLWETIADTTVSTGKNIKTGANKISKYDKEDILAMVGLEPKRSAASTVFPAVGFFAVGILAGVGLGLLFAPKPGYELREDLNEQYAKLTKKDAMDATTATSDVSPVI